jgi:hypothetical protein
MPMRRTNLVLLALSFTLAACASAAKSPSTGASNASSSRITSDEIAAANVATAYDAVYSLHRPWFRDMSAGASGDVFIYVDNRAVEEGKDALRQIPAAEVVTIDYLKSADAVLRFGPRAKGGAIIVTRSR